MSQHHHHQRKKVKKVYTYKCSLTSRSFRTTEEAKNPNDLVCVDAYYDIHPEKDDRPEHIKKQRKQIAEMQSQMSSPTESSES